MSWAIYTYVILMNQYQLTFNLYYSTCYDYNARRLSSCYNILTRTQADHFRKHTTKALPL